MMRAIRKETLSVFGTFLTIFLSMTLPGLFWVALTNLTSIEKDLKESMTIDVFLVEELTPENQDRLNAEFDNMIGVVRATYISKQDALFIMRENYGREAIAHLDENPLPASFVLEISDEIFETGPDSLISVISSMNEVEEVVFAGELIKEISDVVNVMEILGIAVAILVFFSAIFITANTVRIAITDRKITIEIMQLVGATRSYILTPFVTLGGALGILGSTLATLFIWLFTSYFSQYLVDLSFLKINEVFAFILTGLLLGMIGALLAIRKHLRI
jgi:cell division transport system permease protein